MSFITIRTDNILSYNLANIIFSRKGNRSGIFEFHYMQQIQRNNKQFQSLRKSKHCGWCCATFWLQNLRWMKRGAFNWKLKIMLFAFHSLVLRAHLAVIWKTFRRKMFQFDIAKMQSKPYPRLLIQRTRLLLSKSTRNCCWLCLG